MRDFLTILDAFVTQILSGKRELDQDFINMLLQQGVDESNIESAFTVLYNLLINRKLASRSAKNKAYRHITEDEERELPDQIIRKLNTLQIHRMINPADMDYLIYGYLENRDFSQDEEEFLKILKSYRPDAYEYLEFTELECPKKSQNIH